MFDESTHIQQLLRLGAISKDTIVELSSCCRGRDDVSVLRCEKSGVIFLSSARHITDKHYSVGDSQSYYNVPSRSMALRMCAEDDQRRAVQFKETALNSSWIYVGTGLGGLLDYLKVFCKEATGVEPQEGLRTLARESGHLIYPSIDSVEVDHYDIASLFHVFEHLPNPLKILDSVGRCLKCGGIVIVEVPHARDALIMHYNSESFKRHTFWSEHLILHTRESLALFLQSAGFSLKGIFGFQRYPLANHLYWLTHGKPGGHKHWEFMRSEALDNEYANKLKEMDATDTIIAIACKR